jgi:two-component system alkaline phosphatase synthesis response regulator PhoP
LLFPAEKYEIRLASSGFEVGLAVEFEPDLIVLDIDLPDIHGEKICEYLRSIPKTKNIKILALSEDEREMEKLLDIGFDSYLKKPFSHELFLSAVRIVLESKRKRKKNFSKEKEEKIS